MRGTSPTEISKAILLIFWMVASGSAAADPPLKLVVSFSLIADLAQEVGQSLITVTTLVPLGQDPGQYQPKPTDRSLIAHADLVIANGLGAETWLEALLAGATYRNNVVLVGQHALIRRLPGGAIAPQSWQDIGNARAAVVAIADALVAALPDQAEQFRARAKLYDLRLVGLQNWVRQRIATIAEDRRVVVVPNDDFTYFAAAYGITILPLQSHADDADAAARRFAGLNRTIHAGKITALFGETTADNRAILHLAELNGTPLAGMLFSSSLSPPGGPAADYIAMMTSNVDSMVGAMAARPF